MRVYLSNIRPQWPIERQEALLDERVPGWRSASIYRDILSRAAIKRQGKLPDRDEFLLHPSSRPDGDTVYVPTLTNIAWTPSDFIAVLMRLAARHDTLVGLAEEVQVEPGKANVDEIRKAFQAATRRFSGVGVRGGEASGKRRADEALAKCEKIRERWGLPSTEWPTKVLCEEVNISRPTAIQYLGNRKKAQQIYQARLATIARNQARKKRRVQL